MSLQLNVGVGDTGFDLLTTARKLLAVCTSDGVTGVVIRFLDAFGSCFAISPHLSNHIRDVCTEKRHTILGELKVAVGYIRGDASAILADSSGGLSAISFIIAVTEIFGNDDIPWVMGEIAKDSLPAGVVSPSSREMVVFLSAIYKRCQSFDFCTHYAKVVTSIRRTRAARDSAAAFDNLTTHHTPEVLIPLLREILLCPVDTEKQLHIEGDEMMGWISAAVSWWYGSSVEIVSEDLVIWPCMESRPRYKVRVIAATDTKWWHESKVSSLPGLLRKDPSNSGLRKDPHEYSPLTYPTRGFVQEALGSLGFPGGKHMRVYIIVARLAFCLVESFDVKAEYLTKCGLKPLMEYFGPSPGSFQCINRSLQHTCSINPADLDSSEPGPLLQELDDLVMKHVSGAIPTCCICGRCAKRTPGMWYSAGKDDCPHKKFRGFMGELILKVFLHLFIDSESHDDFRIIIGSKIPQLHCMLPIMAKVWNGQRQTIKVNDIHECIAAWLGIPWGTEDSDSVLGSSLYGTCMYIPAAFWPDMRQERLIRVGILRGAFIYKENYYLKLVMGKAYVRSPPVPSGNGAQLSSADLQSNSSGQIWKVTYSVRELVETLKIAVTVEDGLHQQREINLVYAVQNASLSIRAEECPHPPGSTLDPKYVKCVSKTTVAAPVCTNSRVAIVSARGNHQSCLYSCDAGKQAVIMQGSCLNCGIEKALNLRGGGLVIDGFN